MRQSSGAFPRLNSPGPAVKPADELRIFIWDLELGISLVLGCWCLELFKPSPGLILILKVILNTVMKPADQDNPGSPHATIRPLRDSEEARACAELMSQSEPWITLRRDFEHALNLLSDRAKEVYIAHVGESIAGHVTVNMQGALTGYIQVLVVAPAWRSRGIGAQLMSFAEERIFRESPNVFLCVSGFNPRAQQFYHRLGYEHIGELKDYVIAGESEFLMRKTIGPRTGFRPRA